jgi:hypothetical protein
MRMVANTEGKKEEKRKRRKGRKSKKEAIGTKGKRRVS